MADAKQARKAPIYSGEYADQSSHRLFISGASDAQESPEGLSFRIADMPPSLDLGMLAESIKDATIAAGFPRFIAEAAAEEACATVHQQTLALAIASRLRIEG